MNVTIVTPIVLASLCMPKLVAAQARPSPPVPPAAEQIAAAVLPLPEAQRAGATVMGYAPDRRFVRLREGGNGMICLADHPGDDQFHVACYHEEMEPYMARGRELRTQGVTQPALDSIRHAEVLSGRIRMPPVSALYSLTGSADGWNPATGELRGARPLYVVYVPFATAASTGLPTTPVRGRPWLMHAGQPSAHVMFTPDM